MRKSPARQQEETQPRDQVQTPHERPQNPQPVFEPEQAESEVEFEDIAKRAYAIYEERGSLPGSDIDDWLQAEQELRNRVRRDEAA